MREKTIEIDLVRDIKPRDWVAATYITPSGQCFKFEGEVYRAGWECLYVGGHRVVSSDTGEAPRYIRIERITRTLPQPPLPTRFGSRIKDVREIGFPDILPGPWTLFHDGLWWGWWRNSSGIIRFGKIHPSEIIEFDLIEVPE